MYDLFIRKPYTAILVAVATSVTIALAVGAIILSFTPETPAAAATSLTFEDALKNDLGLTPAQFWGDNYTPEGVPVVLPASQGGAKPYGAGAALVYNSRLCTSGFKATIDGSPYLVTAKHCYPDFGRSGKIMEIQNFPNQAATVNSAGGALGEADDDTLAVRFEFPNNAGMVNDFYTQTAQVGKRAAAGGFGTVRKISQPTVGKKVCSYGQVSGWRCGQVVSYDTTSGEVFLDFCTRHGDSGGPVVAEDGAVGVVSVGYFNVGTDTVTCSNGRRSPGKAGTGAVSPDGLVKRLQDAGHTFQLG